MAEYLSIGPVDSNTAMWLRDAAREETAADDRGARQPEVLSRTAGARRSGRTSAAGGATASSGRCCRSARRAGDLDVAIERVLGVERRRSCRANGTRRSGETYAPILAATTPPREVGRLVAQGRGRIGGDLNVGPAISPDGKLDRVSVRARACFSIDLFIADAATGKVAAQADQHGDRSALLEPAVHPLGRRVGRGQPAASPSPR